MTKQYAEDTRREDRDPIEIRSAPHRKIPVADILPNPHRDLDANPVKESRVEELLDSFSRTGFWDNIVVREHPTREGKFQLAYGHNRLAALKSKRVEVDTITVPVPKLSDWDMYCAMVDENETQGNLTPAVVFENVGVGCDLIERALKAVGKEGTFAQFNAALGRGYVSRDTEPRAVHDFGFEMVRNAWFRGEGLGRSFLIDFLPCGKMRTNNISTVCAERYGKLAEKAKAAEATAKRKQAEHEDANRRAAKTGEEREKAAAKASKLREEADALDAEAKRIGGRVVAKEVLLAFDTPARMTDFAAAVRRLQIPADRHEAAAKHVRAEELHKDKIERGLAIWWDQVSGAAAKRAKEGERLIQQEKLRKLIKGSDFTSFLLKIADDLGDTEKRLKIAIAHVHLADARGLKVIESRIAPIAEQLANLVERAREGRGEVDITPASKMLTHQKGI